eukprot:contig_11311_g2698
MAFVAGPALGATFHGLRAATALGRPADGRTPVASHAASRVRMGVLDGLDTSTQQPYTFSRYILGPFSANEVTDLSGEEERENALRAAYRQVFGNAYIMEEERAELAIAESQFKLGALTVKELIRAMAKSSTYRARFFEGASQYRFIELNYKHLMGRAPDSQAEISTHVQLYSAAGYDAEIDSYLDSAEYETVFGENTIPFLRFRGAYTPCDSFNKQCALQGGWANSDKAMGGAALSGWNGSDGHQESTLIESYAAGKPVNYEAVAENTPLKSTAPNWYAVPDPALAPMPAFVSVKQVAALRSQVAALQATYEQALLAKLKAKDPLAGFRSMVSDMPVNDRGVAFSGGDALLANPYALQMGDDSPLAFGGSDAGSYKRYAAAMEADSVSRLEKSLEEAKRELLVLEAALSSSTVTGSVSKVTFAGDSATPGAAVLATSSDTSGRPVIKIASRPPKPVQQKSGGVLDNLPKVGLPSLPSQLPSLPALPKLPNPFAKK